MWCVCVCVCVSCVVFVAGVSLVWRWRQASVVMGLEEESRFARLGVSPPAGVLLYGPSGCGKTALGLALAQSTHATFSPLNVRRACGFPSRGAFQ